MKIEYFPQFIRTFYSAHNISNKDAIEIGEKFKLYLEEKYNGKEEKLSEVWDITPQKVISKIGKPFYQQGYNPAFVLHFSRYIQEFKS